MTQVQAHSSIVGGSTASRVMGCPGSVALCAQMPPKPSSSYAEEGTMLHDVISTILSSDKVATDFIGKAFGEIPFTHDHIDTKIRPALDALDAIDPDGLMELEAEQRVGFGQLIPGAFGSVDVIGKLGNKTIILDWKFGDGVPVEAEGNKQLLFYAAAAQYTPATKWAFEGTSELELIIVQPPHVRRWTTTFDYLEDFVTDLLKAVKAAQQPDAPFIVGDHCRWCPGKPLCPKMTGAVDRALKIKIDALDSDRIGSLLTQADLVEDWIKQLRELAFQMLENDKPVSGYKLVAKRATRQWLDESKAAKALLDLNVVPFEQKLISPAQAEKVLKKSKLALPDDLVAAVSSGSTLAREDDPRPAVLNIGKQLTAALTKLQ